MSGGGLVVLVAAARSWVLVEAGVSGDLPILENERHRTLKNDRPWIGYEWKADVAELASDETEDRRDWQ